MISLVDGDGSGGGVEGRLVLAGGLAGGAGGCDDWGGASTALFGSCFTRTANRGHGLFAAREAAADFVGAGVSAGGAVDATATTAVGGDLVC